MPVPSTALVTALPSLYLNSKALPTPPLSTPPRRHRLRRPPPHSHTHPYRLRSHSRSSLSSVPPPLSTSPRRLCLRRPTLALVLTLTGFVPTPAAPNLEWQWNIDPPTHRTSPPDTPEVSFGLYLTSSVSLQTLPDAHWPGLIKVASAGLTNAVGASPGLIKVASAEPSPIKAPVIHHSHSISTSAKPKTVAQGRSLPTNLPPLVALDLYLTNIVGIATNASRCARAGTCQGRFIRPHQRRCYHPSAQGPELVKVTIYPHAHTRPITPLDPSAPSTNHSASPTHVLTSRRYNHSAGAGSSLGQESETGNLFVGNVTVIVTPPPTDSPPHQHPITADPPQSPQRGAQDPADLSQHTDTQDPADLPRPCNHRPPRHPDTAHNTPPPTDSSPR
ncbi:hypothetical protein EDB89DRAFT_1901364 [Lactarius sanguifluus]|nr:hypothetical protein EDB89DRAFT_1901364 [Lactarius sanguifluus]